MPLYVIGHKNPDTDAICSAIGYADLLRRTGTPEAEAAACGPINARTTHVLKRAALEAPKLILDIRPTAGQRPVSHHRLAHGPVHYLLAG